MKIKDGQKIGVWVTIAKNGTIQLFTGIEPKRGEKSWIGTFYINSLIYKTVKDLVKNTPLSWKSEPEFLEFTYTNS